MPDTAAPAALDSVEASAYLGISRKTLIPLLVRGEIPAHKLGRRWIIGRRALDSWLERGGPPATSDAGQRR